MITFANIARIPRIIHQVWLGSGNRPVELMGRCRDLHPDWEYMLWNESNMPSLRNLDVYNCQSLNGKSDIVRYELLSAYGGFYVDADVYCRKSFNDLRERLFVAEYQHYHNPALKGTRRFEDKFVNGAVLGSIPGHTVLEQIIQRIGNNADLCKFPAWKAVGPQVITEVLKSHPTITPMPFSAFSPYHFTQKIDATLSKAILYESYAVNLWGTTLGWTQKRLKLPEEPTSLEPNVCNAFRNLWTPDLWQASVAMLQFIHKTFATHNIDYSIAFGTALGYERFGAFIPWDDDIDIVVRSADIKSAQRTITGLYCSATFWGGFKIFKCDSPHAGSYPWRYPFVDVFHRQMKRQSALTIPDNFMFPSKPARFAHITVNIPRNVHSHLRAKYTNVDACKAPHWNHSHEVHPRHGVSPDVVSCKAVLTKCAPFMTTYLSLLSTTRL